MNRKKVFILRRAFRRVFNRIGCAGLMVVISILVSYATMNFLILQQAEKSPTIMVYGYIDAIDKQFTNRYYFAFNRELVFDLMLDSKNARDFERSLSIHDAVRVYANKTIFGRYLVKSIDSPFIYLDSQAIQHHHTVSRYLYGIQALMGGFLLLMLFIEYVTFYSKMMWFSNRPKN